LRNQLHSSGCRAAAAATKQITTKFNLATHYINNKKIDLRQTLTDIKQLDLAKSYTYAEYLTWRFSEMVELIKGKVFAMSPVPSRKHQEVSALLTTQFVNLLYGTACKVFAAPFDVRFPTEGKTSPEKIQTVVQPDICVICDLSKLDERGCLGAPDLVVEILSPATSSKDLHEKYDLYEKFLVKEYWVVHPNDGTVLVYSLDEQNRYRPSKLFGVSDSILSSVIQNSEISLSRIFLD